MHLQFNCLMGLFLVQTSILIFFSTKGGFQVPNVKVGDEVDLPEEAICTSTTTGKKFVVGSLNLEQMQTLDAKLGIQIKKKQMLL